MTGEMAQQLSPCHLPSEQEDKSSDLQNKKIRKKKLIDTMSFPKGPVSEIHTPEHQFHPYEYGNGAVSATPMSHF